MNPFYWNQQYNNNHKNMTEKHFASQLLHFVLFFFFPIVVLS